MSRVLNFLKEEFKEAFPATLFLFILFHLIAITNRLILESYELTPTRAVFATLGALVGGKSILVANKLPFVNLFSEKPLIYNVLWRTAIYATMCCLFLCVEEIVTGAARYGGIEGAVRQLRDHMSPPQIAACMIWLCLALFLFNSFSALDRFLGRGTIRRLFLIDIMSNPGAELLLRSKERAKQADPN